MKEIPNKIYIDEDLIFYYSLTDRHVGDLEYIRKDALLAFLNERRKGLPSGESFVAGERKMLKEIIDKLNSM